MFGRKEKGFENKRMSEGWVSNPSILHVILFFFNGLLKFFN